MSREVPKVHRDAHPSNFEIPKAPHHSCGTQEKRSDAVSPPTIVKDPRIKDTGKERW